MASIIDHLTLGLGEEGFGDHCLEQPAPTDAPAGSLERIQVYRQRIENGEVLFCGGDTTQ
jgi:hypothetical protein